MIPKTPAGRHERLSPGHDRNADPVTPLATRGNLNPAEARGMRWALAIGLAAVLVLVATITVGTMVSPGAGGTLALAGP